MIAPLHNASQIDWLYKNVDRVHRQVDGLLETAANVGKDEGSHPETVLDAFEIVHALEEIDFILRDLLKRHYGREA
jgi:hypothetical protein